MVTAASVADSDTAATATTDVVVDTDMVEDLLRIWLASVVQNQK